jgi:hypothetical protein
VSRTFIQAISILLTLCIVLIVWNMFVVASSFSEMVFRYRLEDASQTQKQKVNMAELTPFEWEEVCMHHPYDGDFKHPTNGRTYVAPMSNAHDGVWSLLFIEKNGDPTYISGSCRRGAAKFQEFSCLTRETAIFELVKVAADCPFYAAAL